jgi:phage FluMu protein Com
LGSFHQAKCECGYSTTVQVGGARATYKTESFFPYFCGVCGLVDVNVAAEKIECPRCHGQTVNEYGKEPISQNNDSYLVLQNFSRGAKRDGNFCPKCKNFTLSFASAIYRID